MSRVRVHAVVRHLAWLALLVPVVPGCDSDDSSGGEADVAADAAPDVAGSDAADGGDSGDAAGPSLTWPPPEHRATAEACSAPAAGAATQECSASQPGPGEGVAEPCTTAADCTGEGDLVCLDTYVFGAETACQCHEVECLEDSDCASGEVCHCGTLSPDGGRCGGFSGVPCSNRCLPSECRTDADCGEDGFCSPSKDVCGWQVEGWYCHDRDVDECAVVEDCPGYPDTSLLTCRYSTAEQRWTCGQAPVCD